MKQRGMGIVAHSSLYYKKKTKKPSSLCLSFFLCPPNNMIVSGDIILHFNFFPTHGGKIAKLEPKTRKSRRALRVLWREGGSNEQKGSRNPLCCSGLQPNHPAHSCFWCLREFVYQVFMAKRKMYCEMRKMILFSPIPAIYGTQR